MASRYSNRWTNGYKIVKSEKCPGEYWFPMYAESRVHGHTYRQYLEDAGSPEWVKAANRDMADAARYNFERRK